MGTDFLNPRDASGYLRRRTGRGIAVQTLARLRCQGGGPAFHRFGRNILYRASDLDAWLASKITAPLASTSDVAAAA